MTFSDRLRALSAEATPGPWREDHESDVADDAVMAGDVLVAEGLSHDTDDAALIALLGTHREAIAELVERGVCATCSTRDGIYSTRTNTGAVVRRCVDPFHAALAKLDEGVKR